MVIWALSLGVAQQLVRVFTQFGGIKALRLAEASASASRRAWVEFDSQEAASRAKDAGSLVRLPFVTEEAMVMGAESAGDDCECMESLGWREWRGARGG